jgi:excisionase family DNA binding protein
MRNQETDDVLLTPDQLAKRWHLCRASVLRMIKAHKIPAVRFSYNAIRIRLKDVEHFEEREALAV